MRNKLFLFFMMCLMASLLHAQLEQEYIDLGLPSGTLWKNKNEAGSFYTYRDAKRKFGERLPTKEQFEELKDKCHWSFSDNGMKFIGPNGNSIVLPITGLCGCSEQFYSSPWGYYWSSTPYKSYASQIAWEFEVGEGGVRVSHMPDCTGFAVRLVQKP